MECSITKTKESENWPEGVISAKLTMNAYLLAMAQEEALKKGIAPWEFINVAIWKSLGEPDQSALLDFAAGLEVEEEDPKWKKRLKITARYEVEMAAARKAAVEAAAALEQPPSDGDGKE